MPAPQLAPAPATISAVDASGGVLTANPTLTQGASVLVTAGGFAPGEPVTATLFSTPRPLSGTSADELGAVRYRFVVPFDMELGAHRLELVGAARTHRLAFTVVGLPRGATASGASADDSNVLPSTGSGWVPKAFFAVLLLWLGLILLRHATHLRKAGQPGTHRRRHLRGNTT